MILLVDNYDNSPYNLVQLFRNLTPGTRMIRSDKMTVDEIKELHPSHVILSPGPGYPKNARVREDMIREMRGVIPILNVCPGRQAIYEVFGAITIHMKKLMYGGQSIISLNPGCPLFAGLPDQVSVAGYHFPIAPEKTLPNELLITAQDDIGKITAVWHRKFPIYGLQFHPESIMTPDDMVILKDFLKVILWHSR